MDKLKPCPFCGCADRRVSIRRQGKNGYRVICGNCGATGPYVRIDAFGGIKLAAQEHTINAWNHQARQSNDPLTLDELREMDGEPVWIDLPTLPNWEPKCKVMLHYNDSLKYINWSDCSSSGTNGYGKVWLAYRRKPEVQNGA